MKSSGKFEFRPYEYNTNIENNPFAKNYSPSSGKSIFANNNNDVTSKNKMASKEQLLHSVFKEGKVVKKQKPNKRFSNTQCFNLEEKEKFRQLIMQNLHLNKLPETFENKFKRNAYQNLIHCSPKTTCDDNALKSRQLNKAESIIEKYTQQSTAQKEHINPIARVSLGYTRRISLSIDSTSNQLPRLEAVKASSTKKNSVFSTNLINLTSTTVSNNKSKPNNDDSIVELDLTSIDKQVSKKLPIKRNTQNARLNPNSNDDEDDVVNDVENDDSSSDFRLNQFVDTINETAFGKSNSLPILNKYLLQSKTQNIRNLTEFEKKCNDTLNKNSTLLNDILKTSQVKCRNLAIEEERYKYKKRQRLEREKIEKELALKFSQQLHLDANRFSFVTAEPEPVIEEDEFPELLELHDKCINDALSSLAPSDEVLSNAFSISITRKDIQTLRGLNWLNDEIINFYMNLICERSQTSQTGLKTYAFSTFFYSKLIKDGYSSLKRWTRKVDIFSYNLIVVPIHLGLHWTLAVVDMNCQEIRYYDSMNGNNNECLKALRNYLKEEHADKKGSQLDVSNWNCIHVKDIPQQMNGSDCGMFACKYAEYISRGKTVFNFNQSHMPYFRRRMIWEIVNKKLM